MSDHLVKLEKYTKEAAKLNAVQPLAAYYLRLRAATQAMRIPNRPPDVTDFLQQLLQQLEGDEKSKATPSDEAFREIETMALKILADADDQYQARKATKQTVFMLKTAYLLIDSLRAVAGETVDEDLSKKEKYAQIKAIEIRKALQEGRVPGPPMSDAEAAAAAQHLDSALSQPPSGLSAAAAAKEEADLMRELESFGEGSSPLASGPSGAAAAAAAGAGPRRPSAGGIGWPPHQGHAPASSGYPQAPVFSQQQPPAFAAMGGAASAPPPPPSYGEGSGGALGGGGGGGGSFGYPGMRGASSAASSGSSGPASIETQARQTAAFTEAERRTKHALSAMRFEDTDTTIDKLYEVIELLRPFGNRHRR